jgi:hypothetical protein
LGIDISKTFNHLDNEYDGCFGSFYFEKNNGLRRNLELLQK